MTFVIFQSIVVLNVARHSDQMLGSTEGIMSILSLAMFAAGTMAVSEGFDSGDVQIVKERPLVGVAESDERSTLTPG
jgi:hypothetical protein